MFRLSQFMKELQNPTPVRRGNPPGPVVIWNLIRRCNLNCKHCYSLSADTDFPGELSTSEVYNVMDDLKDFHVPVLILSGGEPLLRPDIFDISMRAKEQGFYTGLSSNGALITEDKADRIAEIGYDYVGVSLDGIGAVHDAFRRVEGAFDASLAGIRMLKERGVKVGIRFTMTEHNHVSLMELLDLFETEAIDKFYLSHLVYAGRGNHYREDDAVHQTTRNAMDMIFERCWNYVEQGLDKEFVTGNNDADGVYFLDWVRRNHPRAFNHIADKLDAWGGNSSGVNVANIDNLGNVHPDTMWWHHNLGNVKTRTFSEIWQDRSDPIMDGLKASPRQIKGRCATCSYFNICGGNTRVRALQLNDDPWGQDPACYLTTAEISGQWKSEKGNEHVVAAE
ncbi:MAG: heme d1 biosynthesis radical SAM protein NirJ [Rhodospirillaceae bacterium]|jgi:Fe-coproporphyrin III synthase|nr:heme d1 biosynthesis radical SAM protein NirJ [Rhodospirillaceae bacterium]MBT4589001.1 heme d1 biosynthesis radical SAM protein NirJ [Rhodospirillaceae bacterium]MBT4939083.1 heme d1 biosynthesis radical SAM protein NirJ [Rhodospirillaceae bacterium]MBT5940851.1 heme d1 biosynthesis radical SAM protein NirJ [Rhodospirillaceae bacterium]MBT7266685.1 heme d1 biosynthesis radical SAM protein NirJ [Rhodospirillaceae bacterium]